VELAVWHILTQLHVSAWLLTPLTSTWELFCSNGNVEDGGPSHSKKLDTAQMKYSAFDRELLAAYLAVRHFRFLLEGRDFTLFTDHKFSHLL
jgi:RNase H-like domain found in reverse transcriptase